MESIQRLVVVSNRLPVVLEKRKEWRIRTGSGGLVSALAPVLRDRGGVWIGWLGITKEEGMDPSSINRLLASGGLEMGYKLLPVELTAEEVKKYYEGFSNEILWPLFHDLSSRCNFEPEGWNAYRTVNRKFAEKIVDHTSPSDYLWIHDYHLILVARQLKELASKRKAAFFLHIPFPSLDIFLKLPWRHEVMDSLLEYDLIGFQTARDLFNFLRCVRMLKERTRIVGRGQIRTIVTPEREVRAGAFPIGIDFNEFSHLANEKEVLDRSKVIRSHFSDRKLILGVDRLDYTKGIKEKIQAFTVALERYPELHGKISLIQVLVPSRTGVPEYQTLKEEIERMVGEINGRFSQVGWTPIHYIYRNLNRKNLVAYYRTCDMALVTSLKDGMNLVAKEYCASSISKNNILLLSEFAGAAAQLHRGAIIINPYDREGVADAIFRAFKMEKEEILERMRILRKAVRQQDIFQWVNNFLKTGASKRLDDFPYAEVFIHRRQQLTRTPVDSKKTATIL